MGEILSIFGLSIGEPFFFFQSRTIRSVPERYYVPRVALDLSYFFNYDHKLSLSLTFIKIDDIFHKSMSQLLSDVSIGVRDSLDLWIIDR